MAINSLPDEAKGPSTAITVLCIVLVALTLRPGIVSIGPLLPNNNTGAGFKLYSSLTINQHSNFFDGSFSITRPVVGTSLWP